MGTVSLVGDVMIARPFAQSGRGTAPEFRAAVAAARESDLVIANLEMPLSRRGHRVPKWANLRSDPDVIQDVRAMGVDAVTLANNHMCDYGPEALFDTLEACRGAGIACCGAGPDLDSALAPAALRAGGVPVAVLSVACTLPIESSARPGRAGIAPIEVRTSLEADMSLALEQPGTVPAVRSWAVPADQKTVCDRVAALRTEGQTVIVGIHWGVPEHWLSPSLGRLAEYQRPLGHALVDAGAEIVFGHHSHSLHPVEVYRGKPIFYSAGNFLFEDPRSFMGPESIIVQATVAAPSGGGRAAGSGCAAVTIVPAVLDAQGFPALAAGADARCVLGLLADLSKEFDTVLELEGDRARLRLNQR
jgi:poly-gamma-glutamate capsule biosynthesis protein CapA/YwtB (metallophosphatase superfamily)